MDKTFKAYATAQVRLFLFAGHDTTSSTLCYCYHLLSSHPEAMATLRAEHDTVLGTDLSKVPSLLIDNPHLLNQLPYTLAVIKETMRLFPAASSMREGSAGVTIIDEAGNSYPTEGVYVWVLHLAIQRNPKYWKEPDSFITERWLVGPDDPLYPVKRAWQPFEFASQLYRPDAGNDGLADRACDDGARIRNPCCVSGVGSVASQWKSFKGCPRGEGVSD